MIPRIVEAGANLGLFVGTVLLAALLVVLDAFAIAGVLAYLADKGLERVARRFRR